jgi:hypothetical protein
VRPNQAGSHGDIWLGFINKVFKTISYVNPYCVFLLWGREAQKVKPMIGERSVVLEASHPSGLSARRGFFGCNHFNLVNEHLIRQEKVGINWRISTLSELSGFGVKSTVVTKPIHQPMLAPINVNELPSVIPLKPQIRQPVPTILSASFHPLPIIPNIKDQTNISQKTDTKPSTLHENLTMKVLSLIPKNQSVSQLPNVNIASSPPENSVIVRLPIIAPII